jgi:hypothetical protein
MVQTAVLESIRTDRYAGSSLKNVKILRIMVYVVFNHVLCFGLCVWEHSSSVNFRSWKHTRYKFNLEYRSGQVRTETKVGKSLVGLGLGTLGLESCPCINPVDGRKYGVFRNQLAAARHVDNIEIS